MELEKRIQSISERLDAARKETELAQERQTQAEIELAKAMQEDFERKHGVKRGCVICSATNDEKYIYDRLSYLPFGIFVICHPIKKDGTAAKRTLMYPPSVF